MFVLYLIPLEGNFDIDAGDGMGGGEHIEPQNPQKSKKITKNSSYENCSHFWDIFQKVYKHIFKQSSYIQKNSLNPINAVKITIYNTKFTPNTNIIAKINK